MTGVANGTATRRAGFGQQGERQHGRPEHSQVGSRRTQPWPASLPAATLEQLPRRAGRQLAVGVADNESAMWSTSPSERSQNP